MNYSIIFDKIIMNIYTREKGRILQTNVVTYFKNMFEWLS